VSEDVIAALPEAVRCCQGPDTLRLEDYWPLLYRLRHALVRRLPARAVNRLAHTKAAMAAR
jgi:hypothetical protein